jgi:hypothetical protein
MRIQIEDVYLYGLSTGVGAPKLVARLRTANGPRLFDVETIRIDGDSQELPFDGYEPDQEYEQ